MQRVRRLRDTVDTPDSSQLEAHRPPRMDWGSSPRGGGEHRPVGSGDGSRPPQLPLENADQRRTSRQDELAGLATAHDTQVRRESPRRDRRDASDSREREGRAGSRGRRRHHRRRYDSRSRSNSSSWSRTGFRFPTGARAGHENSIQELARKKPGVLLQDGLRLMQKHIDPTRGGTGGEKFPATAVKYVTQVLQVLQGARLGERDTRELKTLAAAMDCLATGRLCNLGDILMQRFKSIETAKTEGGWQVAGQQELIPIEYSGISSQREKQLAVKQTVKKAQLEDAIRRRPREARRPHY